MQLISSTLLEKQIPGCGQYQGGGVEVNIIKVDVSMVVEVNKEVEVNMKVEVKLEVEVNMSTIT